MEREGLVAASLVEQTHRPDKNVYPLTRRYRKIMGREVFLLDETASAIWEINPEPGTPRSRPHDFDRLQATIAPFVNVWWGGDVFYASRFKGDTYRIDLGAGSAAYSAWART